MDEKYYHDKSVRSINAIFYLKVISIKAHILNFSNLSRENFHITSIYMYEYIYSQSRSLLIIYNILLFLLLLLSIDENNEVKGD